MTIPTFRGYLVEQVGDHPAGRLADLTESQLPAGNVTIRVAYSALNYKDALAARGHPGVAKSLPHVPGVDAAGTVVASEDDRFCEGDEVVVTGNELGAGQWGGWAEFIRVPGDWIIPRPASLSLLETMILGTAGFTAAQCVQAIKRQEIQPDNGEVLVTGATGGVGCLAVKLLAHLGYQVVASTGKAELAERLQSWGAARVIDRQQVSNNSQRPLLSARWAAAVDTVGGNTLTTVLRETKPYGCVAACGLVAGADLKMTVHPFLLRGITLAGIASATCPFSRRQEIWRLLANDWRLDRLDEIATVIELADIGAAVEKILRGEIVGRTVIRIAN